MSRYLRSYLTIIAGMLVIAALGLWAVGLFDWNPRWRMLIILLTGVFIVGTTRMFLVGRRDDD